MPVPTPTPEASVAIQQMAVAAAEQIPNIVRWAPLLSAAATSLAVLVALFRESLFLWWREPALDVQCRMRSPDCNRMDVNIAEQSFPAYYLRLWVKNTGRTTAIRVQLFVAEVYLKEADGVFREVKRFLPMNLRWSHGDKIFSDGIAPGMGQHCEFGNITPVNFPSCFPRPPGLPPNKTRLELETEAKNVQATSSLGPGEYKLRLKLAASNTRPKDVWLAINFLGDWYDSEDQMFSTGIGVRTLAGREAVS